MKNLFFSNLNGFRALAAFAVILAHCSYWIPSPKTDGYSILHFFMTFNGGEGGRLGVIFFFILSGFLISYLLFTELKEYGKINLIYFYLRRFFRIWPLYLLVIFIGFFIYPFFVIDVSFNESASLWMYLCFLANFDHIYNYFPASSILGVQWSVSVEEQFYLFWPILIRLIAKTKYLMIFLICIILFSEIFYLTLGIKLRAGEYHLISCMKYLSAGGLLAYLCFHQPVFFQKITDFLSNKINNIVIYIISFVILFCEKIIIDKLPIYKYFIDIVPLIFFMYVIFEQNYSSNSFYKIGKFKLLDHLGKISYGLYLLHMIVINFILIFLPRDENYFLEYVIITIVATIILSILSFNYFEAYFLKFNRKYKMISSEK